MLFFTGPFDVLWAIFSLTQILQELLALGDKMGTVSTALSEEALSRSLKRSIYQETDETGAISLNKDDDIKCSICQVSLFIYFLPQTTN